MIIDVGQRKALWGRYSTATIDAHPRQRSLRPWHALIPVVGKQIGLGLGRILVDGSNRFVDLATRLAILGQLFGFCEQFAHLAQVEVLAANLAEITAKARKNAL